VNGSLPSGRVTFAFTDVVGSTRLFAQHGDAYVAALQQTLARVADVSNRHDGVVVKTEGDGVFLVFARAVDAVCCLRELQEVPFQPGGRVALEIRAGAHTGEAVAVEGDYLSFAVHVAARVTSAAGAGQALVTESVIRDLPEPVGEDVGSYELRDVADPVRLWRIAGRGLPPGAVPERRTNVAPAHSSFVGRQNERDRLGELLGIPGVATVVGPGGVGKTRLVSEHALAVAGKYDGGAWLVELAGVPDGGDVLAAVAAVIGADGKKGLGAVAECLRSRGMTLLMLDNCEHVLDAASDLVVDLIAACPDLRVLATSRERLGMAGERVLRLAPLADAVDASEPGPAEQLFLDRARSSGADVSKVGIGEVRRICRALDRLPLAIELAAARANDQPLVDLAEAVEQGMATLEQRGGHQRQRSVAHLVDWSLSRLPVGELRALIALAVLPGSFDAETGREMLGHIDGADRGAIPALVRRSLLDLDGERYRMLSVVRQVVRRAFDDPTSKDAVYAGLFKWACGLTVIKDRRYHLISRDLFLTLEEVAEWALPQGLRGGGVLLDMLGFWVLEYQPSARFDRLCDELAAIVDAGGLDGEERALVSATLLRRRLPAYIIDPEQTLPWADHAASLEMDARATCTGESLAYCLIVLSWYAHSIGDLQRSMELSNEVWAMLDVPLRTRGPVAGNIGVCLHIAGRLREAEQWYRRRLGILEPDDRDRARTIVNLAEVLLDLNDPKSAASLLRPYTSTQALGDTVTAAPVLSLYLEALLESGRIEIHAADDLAGLARTRLSERLPAMPSLNFYIDRLDRVLSGPVFAQDAAATSDAAGSTTRGHT
jgi:class 3 adenylate cyclase